MPREGTYRDANGNLTTGKAESRTLRSGASFTETDGFINTLREGDGTLADSTTVRTSTSRDDNGDLVTS